MFCPKCGEKNSEGTNFCTKCGESLKENKQKDTPSQNANSTSNPGGIRKALKMDARKNLAGSFIGATALYLVICAIIGALFGSANNDSYTIKFINQIVIILVGTVFGYGLLAASFKKVRGKTITFTDVFKLPFENIKQLGYVVLLMLLCMAIGFVAGVLMVIPLLGILVLIALMVAMVYFIPVLSVFEMILADTENLLDLNFTDTFKKALDITKGKRVEYYGTALSFVGWCLLFPLTLGIIAIWLVPYIDLTLVNLYRRWIGEEDFETSETGISNGAVIGLSVGGCGCLFIVLASVFAALIVAVAAAIGSGEFNMDDFLRKIEENGINEQTENKFEEYFNNLSICIK